ncbi:MAG: pilus assembly protein [Planctomycetes bacterium]|nr:pilus assembly protein [Planctomycetota bacterium]
MRKSARGEAGYAMAEFAIVFPVQIFITLAVMQLCLIYAGHEVVQYAAFAAARARMVGEDPLRAAKVVTSAVAGTTGPQGVAVDVPGWGPLPRSPAADTKTRVVDESSGPTVQLTVEHDFELSIPVINTFFALGAKFLYLGDGQGRPLRGPIYDGVPHLTIRERCALYRPWED